MLIVESIRQGNVLLVPSRVACLRASEEQERHPPRIEGIEDTVGITPVLDSQLSQASVARARDRVYHHRANSSVNSTCHAKINIPWDAYAVERISAVEPWGMAGDGPWMVGYVCARAP